MRILVTNDDGILSEGLWALVRELRNIAQVVVAAPDREQSAIGTAVTLRQVLRVRKMKPLVPQVVTYSIEGTPSDSVILALGKLVRDNVDLVISGINHGMNLGEDVHISGTVAAALQGYLRGFPALAISAPNGNGQQLDNAARVAALLAKKFDAGYLPNNLLLNVNLPDVSLTDICGVKITRLASESHINTVDEGDDGRQKYYWLVRQAADKAMNGETDMGAVEQGYISITPLHENQHGESSIPVLHNLCSELFHELKKD